MQIRDILDDRRIILELEGSTKEEILGKLSDVVVATHSSIDRDQLVDVLLQRERTSTTAIADGIAIPHGKIALGDEVICAFGISRAGLQFDSVDGKPTHLFFLLVSPESHPSLHLRWLAHLAVLLKNADFRRSLLEAETAEDVISAIDRQEEVRAKETAATDQ